MRHDELLELYCGLPNLHNNCWFNSVITAMMNCYGAFRAFCSAPLTRALYLETIYPVVSTLTLCSNYKLHDDNVMTTILNEFAEMSVLHCGVT